MQVNQSLKLLKKINSVFHTIMEDGNAVSALEKQLLRSYVIQFYDSILDKKSVVAPKSGNGSHSVQQVPAATRPAAVTTPVQNPTLSDLKEAALEPTTPIKENNPPEPAVAVAAPISEKNHQHSDSTRVEDVLKDFYANIETDIGSSHIGQQMEKDLKKSIGLNDKLRFANDLFAGDQSKLLDTLEHLNTDHDEQSIKDHLNQLAIDQNWTDIDQDKQETVKHFIGLIFSKKGAQ